MFNLFAFFLVNKLINFCYSKFYLKLYKYLQVVAAIFIKWRVSKKRNKENTTPNNSTDLNIENKNHQEVFYNIACVKIEQAFSFIALNLSVAKKNNNNVFKSCLLRTLSLVKGHYFWFNLKAIKRKVKRLSTLDINMY